MALTNPITGQPLTQPTFSNPFGGTVPTQKNQDILNEDYNYKRPVEQTPTPVIPAQPTAEPIRPVLTPNSPYTNALNNFKTNNPDEDKIRQQEETRARLQAQTDALNTIYDKQLADQKQVYTGLQGQSRALASRGGRLESPIYQSQQIGLSDKQQQLEGVINAERTQQIANLYDRVEKRVQDKLAAERTFATSERDKYLNILKDQQAQAKGDLVTFSQGGGSLTDLTTEQYQKLLNDTGFDDFTLKATMSVNNPKSKAQFSAVGDKIVGYYVNPKTGQFETFESKEIPGLSGKDAFDSVKEFGGVPYVMTKDENGNITGKPLDGYTKPEEKLSGAPAEYEYYKKQEEAAGRTPISFNEYQNQDANRKAIIQKIVDGTNMSQQQINTFNSIVNKYNQSPLVRALDRTPVLKSTIEQVRKDPTSGPSQLNLVYSYIQALDTYQSSVREGELNLVNSIDSKTGKLQNYIQQIQNGQIVRPDVIKEIADAAENIVNTIDSAAKTKTKSFAAQADVSGVGDAWTKFAGDSGITSTKNTPIDQVDWANVN